MKEARHDDERLAALLDGTLTDGERQELLAELAASGDDYDVFVETAALLQEMEDADSAGGPAPDGVIPIRPRARPRWGAPARWGALAAGIAGVALVASLAGRRSAGEDPVRVADRLAHAERGVPEGWVPLRSSSRGGARGTVSPGLSASAGALLVDLSVEVQAGDTAGIRELADRVRTRYDSQGGPSSPFRQIAERAGAPADSLARLLAEGTKRLEGRMRRDHLRLGAWVEAARLAEHAKDVAFFQARETRAMLRSAERLTRDDAAARQPLARVRAALPSGGPPRWEALRAGLDALQTELASD